MEPVVSELEEIYEGKLIVRKVDLSEERDMGRKYKIRTVPTLMLFDRNGDLLERQEGYMVLEELQGLLAKYGIRYQVSPVPQQQRSCEPTGDKPSRLT